MESRYANRAPNHDKYYRKRATATRVPPKKEVLETMMMYDLCGFDEDDDSKI